MSSIQRTAGNRAAGAVARSEGQQDAVASRPAMTPAPDDMCQLVMPRLEAEAYLIASSSVGSYAAARLAEEENGIDDGHRCLDAPHLDVLDEAEFEAAWVEYAVGASHPDTGEEFTEETAVAFIRDRVRGFQDGERTVLRLSRAVPGVTVHEVLHRLSGTWPTSQGHNVNEGFTDLFTRRVVDEYDIPSLSRYDDQVAAVEKLAGVAGMDAVAEAYFGDDASALRQALTDTGLRRGTLGRWVDAVNEGEYVVASMILDGEWFPPGQEAMSTDDENDRSSR